MKSSAGSSGRKGATPSAKSLAAPDRGTALRPGVKVSVITPVYEASEYLPVLLDSLRNQTLAELEFIFIDDKGCDGSFALVQQAAAQDARIVCLENPRNMGPGYSRNVGIAAAQGEFIAFADADDYVAPDFYERLYNKAKSTGAYVVKGACVKVFPDGQEEPSVLNQTIAQRYERFDSVLNIFVYDFWTGLYSSEHVRQYNAHFPTEFHRGEDIHFLMSITAHLKKTEFAWDNETSYYYRQNPDSIVNAEAGNAALQQGKMEIAAKIRFLLELPRATEVNTYFSNVIEGRLSWYIDNAMANGASEQEAVSYLTVLAHHIREWQSTGYSIDAGAYAAAFADLNYNPLHFLALRKLYRRLHRLEQSEASLRAATQRQRSEVERQKQEFAALGESQSQVRHAISRNTNALNHVQQRISKISTHVNELEIRRKEMLEQLHQNRMRFGDVNERISKVSTHVNELEIRRKEMLEQLHQNRMRFGDVNERISKISTHVNSLETHRKDQLEQIRQNRMRIGAVNERIGKISVHVDSLESRTKENRELNLHLKSDLETLEKEQARTNCVLSEQHSEAAAMLARLDSLSNQLKTLESQAAETTQANMRLQKEMKQVQEKHSREIALLLNAPELRMLHFYYRIATFFSWGKRRKKHKTKVANLQQQLQRIREIKQVK